MRNYPTTQPTGTKGSVTSFSVPDTAGHLQRLFIHVRHGYIFGPQDLTYSVLMLWLTGVDYCVSGWCGLQIHLNGQQDKKTTVWIYIFFPLLRRWHLERVFICQQEGHCLDSWLLRATLPLECEFVYDRNKALLFKPCQQKPVWPPIRAVSMGEYDM